ncbi:hypothetical protein QJS66_11610 [Kocuria rhizophila]|nr:hypothetical protein QJS66_11610 [Kocuria rhizophila]
MHADAHGASPLRAPIDKVTPRELSAGTWSGPWRTSRAPRVSRSGPATTAWRSWARRAT